MSGTLTAEKGTAANERLEAALKGCRTVLDKVQARQGEVEKLQNLELDLATRIAVLEDSDPCDENRVRELVVAGTRRGMVAKRLETLDGTPIVRADEVSVALEAAKACIRQVLLPIYHQEEVRAVSAVRDLCSNEPEAVQMARQSPKLAWASRVANANGLGSGADIPTLEKAAAMLEVIASGEAKSLLSWPPK